MQIQRIAVSNQFSTSKNQRTQVQGQPNFGDTAIPRVSGILVDELAAARREAAQITAKLSVLARIEERMDLLRARMKAFSNRGLDIPGEYVMGP